MTARARKQSRGKGGIMMAGSRRHHLFGAGARLEAIISREVLLLLSSQSAIIGDVMKLGELPF